MTCRSGVMAVHPSDMIHPLAGVRPVTATLMTRIASAPPAPPFDPFDGFDISSSDGLSQKQKLSTQLNLVPNKNLKRENYEMIHQVSNGRCESYLRIATIQKHTSLQKKTLRLDSRDSSSWTSLYRSFVEPVARQKRNRGGGEVSSVVLWRSIPCEAVPRRWAIDAGVFSFLNDERRAAWWCDDEFVTSPSADPFLAEKGVKSCCGPPQ